MTTKNIWWLLVAQFVSSIAFGLKNITESTLLNESIPETTYKSKIFSNIDGKGYSKYCYLYALTTLLSGYLYAINAYIPMALCLLVLIITTVIGYNFNEVKEIGESELKKKTTIKQSITDIKEGFEYIFKSKRLKSLLLMIGVLWGLLILFGTLQVTLLKNMNISSEYIGIILAILTITTGFASKRANIFNKKFKNKSLKVLGYSWTIGIVIAGIASILNVPLWVQLVIIIATYVIRMMGKGIYQIIKKVYMANFIENNMLTKVYSVDGIIANISRMSIGFIGTIILSFMNVQYAMILIGIIFTLLIFGVAYYMKDKVGLTPKQYEKIKEKKGRF